MFFSERWRYPSLSLFERLPDDTPLYLSNEPYMVKRANKIGEQDIYQIMASATEEGVWMFSQIGYWFNLRRNYQSQIKDGDLLTSHTALTGSLLNWSLIGHTLTHYHTHNLALIKATFTEILKHKLDTPQNGYRSDWLDLARNLANVHSCLPSPEDINSALLDHSQMPKGKIEHKIFHPFGITTIDLACSRQLSDEFINTLVTFYRNFFYDTFKVDKGDLHQAITTAIATINQEMRSWLHLTLTPY